jgi:hypothetical protein
MVMVPATFYCKVKNMELAEHWWLTPVILATWNREQEDRSSKPAWANSSVRPYLKNTGVG